MASNEALDSGPDTRHHGAVQDGPKATDDTETCPTVSREDDCVLSSRDGVENEETGCDGVADNDALRKVEVRKGCREEREERTHEPRLPPRQTGAHHRRCNHECVQVERIGEPAHHETRQEVSSSKAEISEKRARLTRTSRSSTLSTGGAQEGPVRDLCWRETCSLHLVRLGSLGRSERTSCRELGEGSRRERAATRQKKWQCD